MNILLVIFGLWFTISFTIIWIYLKYATPEQIERDCLHTEFYHLCHYEKYEDYLASEIKLLNKQTHETNN